MSRVKKEAKSPSLENFNTPNMSHFGTETVHGLFDLEDLCNGAMIISGLTPLISSFTGTPKYNLFIQSNNYKQICRCSYNSLQVIVYATTFSTRRNP
jgi:hypothetical protein